MIRRLLWIPIVVFQLPLMAAQSPARHVDREQLMRDLTTLASPAFGGRRTGTPGALMARQWIIEQFRDARLAPAGTRDYLQPFKVRSLDAANVIGRLAGREPRARTLVVTAHYDHLGVRNGMLYPGADDNASGVVTLLAAARYFRANPPRHPMLFAALDGEEDGQRGARALLDSSLIERGGIAMNINLDMVSRSDRRELYAAGTSFAPWLRPILEAVQARAAVKILFGHDRPSPPAALEDWTHQSDHGPFHDAGIAWVYFGVEDHPYYHQPTDTSGRVDAAFFGDAADTIIEALRAIDEAVD
jgi:Zn-dependent M28 family amino/carboxypeptidase